jgi:hypothetical protein
MSDHQPIEDQHRNLMNNVAAVLDDAFKPYGFCLLVFPMDGSSGRMNYICNAQRQDMLVAMREFIAANEGRLQATPKTPQ